jgi:CRISPR/Cas system-associated exonuclease Cas4 (RecB family)
MNLTKTDFKEYLICPKWLWVKKKKPELAVEGEMSLFLKKLIKDGYEVEEFAQQMFPNGVEITGNSDVLKEKTQEYLEKNQTMFQATFETDRGLFAKVDVLEFDEESGKWNIYEIKASSSIKTDLQHNHLKDITFQTIVVEESGVPLNKSLIIHINKKYKRDGEINPRELFVIEDVSEDVQEGKENVNQEIETALDFLNKDEISMEGCECLYKSHGQHCDSFTVFNPKVPGYSVHHIVGGKKLLSLIETDVFDVKEIPEDFDLTDKQQEKVTLQKTGKPMIDEESIKETLLSLTFPLYFLDYETFGKPYPILDGYTSNQQIVFQYSLHVLQEDGSLEHYEYMADDFESATRGLLDHMSKYIGHTGTVIVWNESFEKGRNKELADVHPEYADFLNDINNRVYDLMLIFKKDYLHPGFYGSASIKKVLPVMLPELSYNSLEVQDGTMAMSEWEKMINPETTPEEKEQIRKDLLEYCALDTMAMVEIYRFLKQLD